MAQHVLEINLLVWNYVLSVIFGVDINFCEPDIWGTPDIWGAYTCIHDWISFKV